MSQLISFSLAVILLLTVTLQSTSQAVQQSTTITAPAPRLQYLDRLPQHSRPIEYNLEILVDAIDWAFTGSVSILLQVITATNTIALNARDILIPNDTLVLTDSLGNRKTLASVNTNLFEIIEFNFVEQLQPGIYTFNLEFSGKITDNLRGLYRSSYSDENGNTRLVEKFFIFHFFY